MTGVALRQSWDRDAKAFVFSTFASGYRRRSKLDDETFARMVLEPFELAHRRGELAVNLLHLDGSPDDFVGWSAVKGDALVYVYVKHSFRRRGFGKMLLPDALERVVFQTKPGAQLQESKYGRVLRSAPYLLHERRAA